MTMGFRNRRSLDCGEGCFHWTIGIIVGMIFLLALIGFAIDALAHSWYDPECCSDQGCRPVVTEDVIETEDGWKHLPTGTVFSRNQVKPSRDGRFHVCIGVKPWDLGKPYCIYIVQGT